METKIPLCAAETRALRAMEFEAFPINLEDVRRNTSLILTGFGKYGFFDEYTVHDFTHCIEMIKLLDWIIPAETCEIMTPGDWLTIVLACYFHDIGLLVTQE